ncbi:restriction endonuclease subunit S [Micromonospora rifamycinica]|uniref:restriction endonuclease subunit S n=1 Tax=Micromonospora rifamycinica TaxID=291594 RepID=UPI000A0509AD|nr:restriction endonuclease subunit S [Micromonospora rifamycinica]
MVPLRRVAKVVNGGTPPPNPENWGGPVPWATPADFGDTLSKVETTRRTLTTHGARTGSTIVPPGSILLSTRAPIGHVAITNTAMAFNQGCRALVPCSEIESRFLGYQLEALREDLKARGLGTTFLEVSSDSLASMPIAVPSLADQHRIADFLDAETSRLDRIQVRTAEQRSLLSEISKEAIRLATTTGNGKTRSSGVPWMPEVNEQWKIIKLGHAFRTGSGTTPRSDQPEYFSGPHPWVNSADINDGEINRCEKSVTDKALAEFPALKIHPAGSLVVALYGQGETKGRVGVLRIAACLNQACCALTPIGPITAEFAAYWFKAHKQGIVGLALGAGQPNLSQELIRQLRIPAPSIKRQRRIIAELQKFEAEINVKSTLLHARERLLGERRTALITAAVTGQIDVSTASRRGVED